MTRITFIGTGEAFDDERATTSYLVESEDSKIMIDCGYTAPFALRKLFAQRNLSLADSPDGLIITHYHGDHFVGVPALLMPIWEEINGVVGERRVGSKRQIEIASAHPDIEQRVGEVMEHYPGFLERFSSEGPGIKYTVLSPNGSDFKGYRVSAAQTIHGLPNYAYRLDRDGKSLAISGDGAFTDETRRLFQDVDLLIHEGFFVDQASKNHASIKDVIEYAIENQIPKVGIVHVNRQERKKEGEIRRLLDLAKDRKIHVFLPEDFQQITI